MWWQPATRWLMVGLGPAMVGCGVRSANACCCTGSPNCWAPSGPAALWAIEPAQPRLFSSASPHKPLMPRLPCNTTAALQDMTTRLWDLRYPASSFALLKAHIGAIRALRFRCALLLGCCMLAKDACS